MTAYVLQVALIVLLPEVLSKNKTTTTVQWPKDNMYAHEILSMDPEKPRLNMDDTSSAMKRIVANIKEKMAEATTDDEAAEYEARIQRVKNAFREMGDPWTIKAYKNNLPDDVRLHYDSQEAARKWKKWNWRPYWKIISASKAKEKEEQEKKDSFYSNTSLCASNPCFAGECKDQTRKTAQTKEINYVGFKCACPPSHSGEFCQTQYYIDGYCRLNCAVRSGLCLDEDELREKLMTKVAAVNQAVRKQIIRGLMAQLKHTSKYKDKKYCACVEIPGYFGARCSQKCDKSKKEWGYYCLNTCKDECVEGKCDRIKGCLKCVNSAMQKPFCIPKDIRKRILRRNDSDVFTDEDIARLSGSIPLNFEAREDRLDELFERVREKERNVSSAVKDAFFTSVKILHIIGKTGGKKALKPIKALKHPRFWIQLVFLSHDIEFRWGGNFEAINRRIRRRQETEAPHIRTDFELDFPAPLLQLTNVEKTVKKELKKASTKFEVEGIPELKIDADGIKTYGVQIVKAKTDADAVSSSILLAVVLGIIVLVGSLSAAALVLWRRKVQRSNNHPRQINPRTASHRQQRTMQFSRQGASVVQSRMLSKDFKAFRLSNAYPGRNSRA